MTLRVDEKVKGTRKLWSEKESREAELMQCEVKYHEAPKQTIADRKLRERPRWTTADSLNYC